MAIGMQQAYAGYRPRPVSIPSIQQPGGRLSDDQIQQLIQYYSKQNAGGGGSEGGIFGGAGAGAGASQLGSGGAPAFTTAGENAAFNAAGMEASGTPMTLADSAAPVAPESSFLSIAAPIAGAAAGTYLVGKGLNDIRKGRNDKSTKGKAARAQTAVTTGGISEIARGVMGGKGKDQKGRDANRKALQEKGVYDDSFRLGLTDGTMVDMGRDGSKGQYNVDFGQEGIGDIVASVDPLAAIVSGGDKKRRNDLAGELTNAIKGSKDPRAEARALYAKYGIDQNQANELLGAVGGEDTGAFQNSVNSLFSGQVPRPQSKPTPIPRAPTNNTGLQNDGVMFSPSMGGQKGMSAIKNNDPKFNDRMYLVGRDGPSLPGMDNLSQKIPTLPKQLPVQPQQRSKTSSPGIDKNGKRIKY